MASNYITAPEDGTGRRVVCRAVTGHHPSGGRNRNRDSRSGSPNGRAPAARCAIDTVGADRILFGTDAPPLYPLKERGLALVDELGLDPADREKVLAGNAKRLLKLD